ncbi:MAG: T9SS type A sorting domain-containing protein, partial [Bacteroidota bacterium]
FFIPESGIWMNSLTVGIEENEFISDIRYNNPVENNFTINFQSQNNAGYSYMVMNSLGQKMIDGNSEIIAGNTETLTIDFSSFPAGIYFFSVRSDESERAVKTIKIIKN